VAVLAAVEAAVVVAKETALSLSVANQTNFVLQLH
jgi:hypothetical protein